MCALAPLAPNLHHWHRHYVKICTDSHQLYIFSHRQDIVKNAMFSQYLRRFICINLRSAGGLFERFQDKISNRKISNRKISKAIYRKTKYRSRKISNAQNIDGAKYRNCKISNCKISNRKISKMQNIEMQDIEGAKYRKAKYRKQNIEVAKYRSGKISKDKISKWQNIERQNIEVAKYRVQNIEVAKYRTQNIEVVKYRKQNIEVAKYRKSCRFAYEWARASRKKQGVACHKTKRLVYKLNPRRHREGGGLMQPPAVFQEYLFCLPVECHQFLFSLPNTFSRPSWKFSRPWPPNLWPMTS